MHYADWLAAAIHQGFADVPQPYNGRVRRVSLLPADVHTVVLWSKDFRPLLSDKSGLRHALACFDQVFCHLTITGLGGTPLEPNIDAWEKVITQLPELIEFAGDPRRVSVRFDPIIHWQEAQEIKSNLPLAEPILQRVSEAGIRAVRISFATLYGKVRKRKGWRWHDPIAEQRLEITRGLVDLTVSLGLALYSCSQSDLLAAGALPSHCIDGELLSTLHPLHLPAATGKDPGQRPQCGCTPSVDIGSYLMSCPNGCRYCYANPRIEMKP